MRRAALLLALLAPWCAAEAQNALPLPPGYPDLLGVSCGGVHVASYVTGFNAAGQITGEVYAWTTCGGSGRGGGYHTTTYQSWNSIVWDLYRNYKLVVPYDGIHPDPSYTASDGWGNTIWDVCTGSTNGQPACMAQAQIVYVPPGTPPVAVAVPALSGMTSKQAAAALTAAGLVDAPYKQTSTVAPFHVCGQSPAAGTVVDPGSTVSVCISTGQGGGG